MQQYIQKYLILLLPQNNTNRNSIYWKGCFSRWFLLLVSSGSKGSCGDLVVQWLWVCLAMQGTWVQSLFRELRSAGQRSPHPATETWCCQKKKKKAVLVQPPAGYLKSGRHIRGALLLLNICPDFTCFGYCRVNWEMYSLDQQSWKFGLPPSWLLLFQVPDFHPVTLQRFNSRSLLTTQA